MSIAALRDEVRRLEQACKKARQSADKHPKHQPSQLKLRAANVRLSAAQSALTYAELQEIM